jgi:hypothetical protein
MNKPLPTVLRTTGASGENSICTIKLKIKNKKIKLFKMHVKR